jgi:hypothetical protein
MEMPRKKLTHRKASDVFDTYPFDRSARKQNTNASPNEGQTAEGDGNEPV